MNLLDKLIDDPEETIAVQMRENQVIFHSPSATLTSNLVEGQFPPYEDVIPKDTDKKMTAATADFLAQFAGRPCSPPKTARAFGCSSRKREWFSRAGLLNRARPRSISLAEYEGADIEIGFNPNFVTDALKIVDSDEISLELTAPNRPGFEGRDQLSLRDHAGEPAIRTCFEGEAPAEPKSARITRLGGSLALPPRLHAKEPRPA